MDDTQQYAISEYPDVNDVYRRLNALVAQPMRPVKREKMKEYLDYFDVKCARVEGFDRPGRENYSGWGSAQPGL